MCIYFWVLIVWGHCIECLLLSNVAVLVIWQDGFKLRDYRKAETDISIVGDKIDIYIYIYIYIYEYIYIYYLSYITYYILPIDCLSIALDAHMLSHNGYGPGTGSRAHIHYG